MPSEATEWQVTQARQAADDNARNAYNQGMLELGREDLAFRRAQQAWTETMDRAGLTGMYEGQFTMPTQQWFAQQFGTWGAPTAGQKTLGAQQQEFGQGATMAGLYGSYFAPGTAPTQGQQTLAGQNQQWSQAFQEQQFAANEAQRQQQNAQNYLQMLSQLRGPADWAKYQQVLGATPNGMRDLAAAAMGQYIPGGGATTGVQPQAVNLNTMQQQIAGGGYGQAAPYNAQQTWNTAADQTYQQLQGGLTSQPQQQAAQAAAQQQPTQQQNAMGAGTNTMGNPQPQQYNLPAPNQVAPQAWKNLAPSQRDMMMGQWEAGGWYKPDVEALINQSLPKYASNAPTAGTFRLR